MPLAEEHGAGFHAIHWSQKRDRAGFEDEGAHVEGHGEVVAAVGGTQLDVAKLAVVGIGVGVSQSLFVDRDGGLLLSNGERQGQVSSSPKLRGSVQRLKTLFADVYRVLSGF